MKARYELARQQEAARSTQAMRYFLFGLALLAAPIDSYEPLRTTVLRYKEFKGIVIQTHFFAVTKHFVSIRNTFLRNTNKILRKICSQLANEFVCIHL